MTRTRISGTGRWLRALFVILAAGLLPMTAAAGKPSVYFPIDRVVCDRKVWACFDSFGASVPLTKAHLGDDAARSLENRITRAGKTWNPNRFVLSNGVECLVAKKTCYVRAGSEEVDPSTTNQLFGSR